MSLEAWGDDGDVMEGYVTEERALELVQEAIAAAAEKIPTTWLDPLLSGPNAVLQGTGPWGCPDIERLLSAVRKRICGDDCLSRK